MRQTSDLCRYLPLCGLTMILVLTSCATAVTGPGAFRVVLPVYDPLYSPDEVTPGRLSYAPDRSAFAPVLTERFPYPTQLQANEAYQRLLASTPLVALPYPQSIHLFGCRPGAFNAQTARIDHFRAAIVHCATDLLDVDGHHLGRVTANFAYDGQLWTMHPVYPPRLMVPWRDREQSPRDPLAWLPGRDRYQ